MKINSKQMRPRLAILLPVTDLVGMTGTMIQDGPRLGSEQGRLTPVSAEQEEGRGRRFRSGLRMESAPNDRGPHRERLRRAWKPCWATWEPAGHWAPDCKRRRWHDVGKAHAVFPKRACGTQPNARPESAAGEVWDRGRLRHGRKHFRHELASALAVLQQGLPFRGRVPDRGPPWPGTAGDPYAAWGGEPQNDPNDAFALGVHHGDLLPERRSRRGTDVAATHARPVADAVGRREQSGRRGAETAGGLGPFKLAYLEALLRAADVRASRKEAKND